MMNRFSFPKGGPEISDEIVAFDPETLQRKPVKKADVIATFLALDNRRAAAIVEEMAEDSDGTLNESAADKLLVKVHCEMQRMSEEFQHGERAAQLLEPIIEAIVEAGHEGPVRIVDIGCGTGFVIRWLAARAKFSKAVELMGVDFNTALVAQANTLAGKEKLNCRFVVANAFRLKEPATIFISTGVLHHFRGDHLTELFRLHESARVRAFVHFDFHPSFFAPFGSWLFHEARMREPLAKHDGVLSAVRAHPSVDLLGAARTGAPAYSSAIYGTQLWALPIPRAFHSLVGMLPQLREGFIARMGNKIRSLGVIE
jgi:SAM-dependent methyltransferase